MRAVIALPCGHLSEEEVPEWPDGTEAEITCLACGRVVATATVDHTACFCGWALPEAAHQPHREAYLRSRPAVADGADLGKALAPPLGPRMGMPVAANSFVVPGEKMEGPDHPPFPTT